MATVFDASTVSKASAMGLAHRRLSQGSRRWGVLFRVAAAAGLWLVIISLIRLVF